MTERRRWVLKLGMLAMSVAAALLAMEVTVRLSDRDRPLMWEPDPMLGWRNIPGSKQRWTEEGDGWVEINTLGLRDPARSIDKAPGVFRIAVLGDSMTQGVQVDLDETFCQLLEKRLRQRGMAVEVLNFGVNGYGPLQEFLLYSQHVKDFEPDLVLHAVFVDNDIADGDPRLAVGQGGAPFLKRGAPGFDVDVSMPAASYESYHRQPINAVRKVSALYRMLSYARYARPPAAALQSGLDAHGEVPTRYRLYAEPLAPVWEEAWGTFERIVTKFSADVSRAGARYVLVSVPAGQVVNSNAWAQVLERFPAMSSQRWSLLAPERRLSAIADRNGIALITPLHAFSAHPEPTALFFGGVGHLTPLGHQVMVTVLDRELEKRGLMVTARAAAE